ncbi:MAG: hypothetical protein RRZ73_05065 [Oscillospiraceae bacterium]
MYMSLEFEKKFLNVFGGITLPGVSTPYCALFLSDPTDLGTAGIEISYSGYKRMPVIFGAPSAESGGIGIRNITETIYTVIPTGAGGTVQYIGVFDSEVGGTMYLYGKLTEPLILTEGEEPVLIADEMLFYSNGNLSNEYKKMMFNVLRGQLIPGFVPHISLWNGNPDISGLELSGTNYGRVALTMSNPVKTEGGQMSIKNTENAAFNRPTATWGVWNYDVIMDKATGGFPVWVKERTGKTISKGVMPKIAANAVTIGVN